MQKVIIIGAGILGASTAYHLAKKGAEVVIVDRNDPGQATDAAAGIICPWISQRRNQAWYQLAKNGARFYPSLINELEKDGEIDTGYAQVGAISIHKDVDKLYLMEKRALKRKVDAPEMGEIGLLSEEETNRLFPPLSEGYSSIHIHGAARVNGRALRNSLLRAAQKNGAAMIYGDAALLNKGNKVTGVTLNEKTILGDTIIVCAGAWAGQLLQPLNVPTKVTCQKAQIAHLKIQDKNTDKWPVVMPPSDQYVLAFEEGRIVVGATHENDIKNYDTRVTVGGMQEVFNKAMDTASGLEKAAFLEARVGFRPFTPGFLPVIGPLPDWEGILFANGLGASGLTMGPYIGSELAKLALGHELEIDLKNYDVSKALGD